MATTLSQAVDQGNKSHKKKEQEQEKEQEEQEEEQEGEEEEGEGILQAQQNCLQHMRIRSEHLCIGFCIPND